MANAPVFSSAEVTEIPGMQILGEIGRGSQSIVYKVSKDNQIYAAKIPRDIGFQKAKDTHMQFRREAAVLARVRHPGVAEIIEVGDISGHPYLIMEYVEGKTLDEYLEDENLIEKSIVQIAKTLSGALSVVHRYGLVHRDIKPQNILIDQAGAAKLIDFGFAGIVDEVFNKNEVMGTFLYSAPEQLGVLKRPVDGRSDLYSLGVVMFECATGTPPFKANDVGELVRQHAVVAAPDVLELNPSITPALGAVINKLLAKDPDDRYQSAMGLLSDLDNLPSLNATAKKGEKFHLGRFDESNEVVETPLIGRDTEVAILRNKWNEALQRKGKLVLIEGEPGSGKSRLVQELLIKHKNATTVLIRGRCQQHNTTPLAPIKQGIEGYLKIINNLPANEKKVFVERIKKTASDLAPVLKKISPQLAQIFGESPELSETTEALDLLYDALGNFLITLDQQSQSMILLLDDIQWIDDASKKVLLRVSSQMSELPLLVICCARNDRENLDNVKTIVQELGTHLSNRIRLVPLLEGAIAKLVATLLGGHQVDHSFINQIATRTNGNPFAVSEYVRSMLDSGLLRPSWGSWIVDTEGLENLQLPTDVVQLVVKRVTDLEKSTRDILRFAALIGSKFQLNLIPLVCGKPMEQVHAALAEAIQSRLVERGEAGQFVFVHDRVQDTLLSDVGANDLTQMHQKIAEVLDLIGGEGADYIYALAKHYSMGDIDKSALRAYETSFTAGQKALENLSYEESYSFLQQSYQFALIAKQPLSLLLEETFGNVCLHVGRLDEAVTHLVKALEKSTNPLHRAQLRGRITKIYIAGFQTLQAKSEIQKAFFEIGKAEPKNTVTHWIYTLASFYFTNLLRRLHLIGKMTDKAKIERTKTLAQLYEYSATIHFFDFNMPVLIQTTLRSVALTQRIQSTKEQCIA
jgi:serine/threonine protein kinase